MMMFPSSIHLKNFVDDTTGGKNPSHRFTKFCTRPALKEWKEFLLSWMIQRWSQKIRKEKQLPKIGRRDNLALFIEYLTHVERRSCINRNLLYRV